VHAAGAARPGAAPVWAADRGDVEPQTDAVSPVAVAEESAPVPDARRLRAVPGVLVLGGRSLEAAAFSRDARPYDRGQGVAVAFADLRPFALHRGVLPAHRDVGLAGGAGVLPRHRARRAGRAAARLVAHLQGIRVPGIRDAAADSDPRLGAARHRHVHRHRVGGGLSRLPRLVLRHRAQHHARRRVDRRVLRARSQLPGADRWQVFRHVITPGALPFIFTGLQISIGVSWFSLVAAEMVSGQYGLGYVIWTSYVMVRYPTIVIGMVTLGIVGYVTSALVRIAGD